VRGRGCGRFTTTLIRTISTGREVSLLFTQAQLNSYKTAHPNQNFRVVALEDDDTGLRYQVRW
jgi:agmatine/peptidylarginine deiminase